jgi:hydroxymethylglutaryl-CoA reductase
MNGVDAIAIACGQDVRAIESACHVYTIYNSTRYKSLSEYWIKDGYFHGKLELPLLIGTKGGSVLKNGMDCLEMLGNPNSKTLAGIICSVGLAQNFGALRALVTGIFLLL